jgi:hypothetical protein
MVCCGFLRAGDGAADRNHGFAQFRLTALTYKHLYPKRRETIRSPRLVSFFLPLLGLVFALRSQASHDRHTLVI